MCSKEGSFSCRHNASWCSSLEIVMFLAMLAGPSAESFSLINQTHHFFIGRFYKFPGYQHYKRMINAYFFLFIYQSIGRIPKKYCWGPNVSQSSGKQLVQVLPTILPHCPFFLSHDSSGLDRAIFEFRPPANAMFL